MRRRRGGLWFWIMCKNRVTESRAARGCSVALYLSLHDTPKFFSFLPTPCFFSWFELFVTLKWFTHKREREREVNFKSFVQLLYSSFLSSDLVVTFTSVLNGGRERDDMEVLCAHFLLLPSLLFFLLLRLHSLFTFVVYSMCTTGLLTLFASSTHSSLCVSLSLLFKLDFGLAVFFFSHEISGEDGETEIVYTE
jgi:hypothetical protein